MNFQRSLTRKPNGIKTTEAKKAMATATLEANVSEPLTVASAALASSVGTTPTAITSGTNVQTTTAATATETATAAPTVTPTTSKTTSAATLADDDTSDNNSNTTIHNNIYKNFISISLPSIITARNANESNASKKSHQCCCSTNAINCFCNSQLCSTMAGSHTTTMSYKNKKNANQERCYSRRMCCKVKAADSSEAVSTITVNSETPEVMPTPSSPSLTSMSGEQISLTTSSSSSSSSSSSLPSLSSAVSSSSPPSPSSSLSTSRPNMQHGGSDVGCRGVYQNIKMPLRRLMLTIMAAVVLSTEFTICSSSSVLEQKLKTITVANTGSGNSSSNGHHLPAETTNKSYKITDSLPNLPVNLTAATAMTTTTTTRTVATTLSQVPSIQTLSSSSSAAAGETENSAVASAAEPMPMSATSISTSMKRKSSLKTLETAALSEPLPSPSAISSPSSPASAPESLMAIETAEKSPFSSFSLTATTQILNEPLTLDDDFNASSELLTGPTSILNTHDSSDLPPLSEAEQAAKDLLTKGFSIPTYLPPFPVFAVADLPAYLNTVSSTTTEAPPSNHHMSPDDMSSLENLLFFDNGDDQQQNRRRLQQHRKLQIPRRNSSFVGANNVTVQEGSHAYLPCRIHRLQNKPVSWVRLRDGHIISVDQTTFIADQRFQAIFQDDKEYTWSLQIKYVQPSDEGWFECQASSEPKMSAKVYLKVIVPLTELIGDQSRFVKAGSKVALHCIVRGTLDPPQYIIWYRDKTQISDDNKLGWYTQLDRNIFGNNGDNENTIGSLIIPSVRKVDSGNYTCQPSNSASVSVDLHVLSGEYSASAIMSAARTYALNDAYLLILLLLMLLHNT
uniref:Ig-like domain-containing protein n=1 Tax=Musca domestica TaxID=7370 RepID=A0A1I8NE58_MUSDO